VAFVLIVDGNQAHATRASDVLTAAGHACGWVTDAEQALTLLRWRVPELVLLDQAIPGADGGNLPQRLRRTAGASGLPIILLTTDASAASVGTGDNAVLDDIRKPFDPGFLAWRVGHALEAHNPPEEAEPPLADDARLVPRLRSLA
jgi:two-component system phosphate regulon response regulator PhoB